MKKIVLLAILAALSTPASAKDYRAHCNGVGLLAQSLLELSKLGVNGYEQLANDPEKMNEYGFENSVTFLLVAQDMWENRNRYNKAQAFKAGYMLCVGLQ